MRFQWNRAMVNCLFSIWCVLQSGWQRQEYSRQHVIRALRKSVLSLSWNKPFNVYEVIINASFTIFKSLVRAAVEDIVFSLTLHGFEELVWGAHTWVGPWGLLAEGMEMPLGGVIKINSVLRLMTEVCTSGVFLACLNCSMLSPGLIHVMLLLVK